MAKEPCTKVPDRLLVELITTAHEKAERLYESAHHERAVNNPDIARNIDHIADATGGSANEARALIGLPPFPYKDPLTRSPR